MRTKKVWLGLEYKPGKHGYSCEDKWVVRKRFDEKPTANDLNNFLGYQDMIIAVDCLVPPEPGGVDAEDEAANQGGDFS